jgi:two-component system, response regulator
MNKKTVLLIEDSKEDLSFVMRAIKKNKALMNYLIVAYDGEEAQEYLMLDSKQDDKKISFYPNLIILDLKLPFIDGIELLSKIKANKYNKNIPVVVFTSSEDSKDIFECYKLGVNSFVKKPIAYEDFTKTVEEIIHYWLEINITLPFDQFGS